jgi:hypothetical protein
VCRDSEDGQKPDVSRVMRRGLGWGPLAPGREPEKSRELPLRLAGKRGAGAGRKPG